jgi:hypothetical protein
MMKLLAWIVALTLFASPAFAVWGTLTTLGSATGNTGTTLDLTSVTVPALALIVVFAVEDHSTGGGTPTFTDSASNTYAASVTNVGAQSQISASFAYNVTALSSGTITYHRRTTNKDAVIAAFYITGEMTSSTPFDQSDATQTSSSSSLTTAAVTPTLSGELFFGLGGWNTNGTLTQPGGWTNITTGLSSTGTSLGAAYLINSGVASETYNPTLSGSAVWETIMLTFKTTRLSFIFLPATIP